MNQTTIWRIKELLGSGYTAHEVALILDIPFPYVVKVETTPSDWLASHD